MPNIVASKPPIIIPVIHFQSTEQSIRNAKRAFNAGCDAVFLISMDGRDAQLALAAQTIKKNYFPDKQIGINLLSTKDMRYAMWKSISCGLDMTWTDQQLTHSHDDPWEEAQSIGQEHPDHPKFIGVGFKYQPREPHAELAARKAVEFGFIPTTSGPATGRVADVTHIAGIRRSIGSDAPLAIASGITPDNVKGYARYLTHILVSTGVSDSFHEINTEKLLLLRERVMND